MDMRTLSFAMLAAGIWAAVLYFPVGKESLLLVAVLLFVAAWHLLDRHYSQPIPNSRPGWEHSLATGVLAIGLCLASLRCLPHGHDAPGGWCRRCGLKVKGKR